MLQFVLGSTYVLWLGHIPPTNLSGCGASGPPFVTLVAHLPSPPCDAICSHRSVAFAPLLSCQQGHGSAAEGGFFAVSRHLGDLFPPLPFAFGHQWCPCQLVLAATLWYGSLGLFFPVTFLCFFAKTPTLPDPSFLEHFTPFRQSDPISAPHQFF